MKTSYLVSLLLMCISYCNAQSFSGHIYNSQDKSPVPFASIIFNKEHHWGTISNVDGAFALPISQIHDGTFYISCLSYKDTTIKISSTQRNINILLQPKHFDIPEFVVLPKENPAFSVLRKVHKKRKTNNPENLSYFECKEYSQTTLQYEVSQQEDTIKQHKDGLFFETLYHRTYKKTSAYNIQVEATRFPCMKEMPIYLPNDVVQPFHFYEDYIILGDKKYLNPVADRNFSRYIFHLKDSILLDDTRTYIIDYRPKSELSYEGLIGTLLVSSDNWAIKSVTAKAAREDNIMVSILQNYSKTNGHWFPLELHYELKIDQTHTGTPPFKYIGKSYISEVNINQPKDETNYSLYQIEAVDGAAGRDTNYWNTNRPVTLSTSQKSAYNTIDTIGNMDKVPFVVEKLIRYKLPIRCIDIDLTKLYIKNDFEGHRIGLGLATNERLSKRISVGGFVLYGTEDTKYKYGADIELNIKKKTNLKLYSSFKHSYLKDDYFRYKLESNIAIPNSIYNQDFLTEYKLGFKNTLRRLDLNCYAASQSFTTHSQIPEFDNITEDIFATGLYLNFDYYRKNMASWISPYESISISSVIKNQYIPTLEMLFEKAIAFDQYSYNYNKLQLELNSTIYLTKLGRLHYSLQSGRIWGDCAISKIFRGGKMYAKHKPLLYEDAFHTVSQNEFYNTQYTYLFMNYKFGTIALKTDLSRPQFVIYQNIGIGDNDDSSMFATSQSMNKFLFESGLGIENVIRKPIYDIVYIGIGAATYCRYGHHANPNGIKNNLAYKAILTISY